MQRKIIFTAKVIMLIQILNVNCDLDNTIAHKDLQDTKFRYSDRSALKKFSEHLQNSQNYADVQILDDNGQLKTLKFKSAKPKVPLKPVSISDKVPNQVETPIVDNKDGPTKNKPKFFDELEGSKQIMQRWTHIRDSYQRSYKKIQDQKRSGIDAKITRPYLYSKQLRFLHKVLEPDVSVAHDFFKTQNSDSETEEERSEENDSNTNNGSEINSIEANDIVTTKPKPKRIEKRPMMNYVNVVDAKMFKSMDSVTNERQVTNRHLSFFHGILPTLDNFDDNEVLEFQMGVLQLLKKIKSDRRNIEFRGCSQFN